MKKIMLLLVVLTACFSFSQEKSKKRKLEIYVAGNCEMCKKRIENAAFSVKGVKMANWDVSSKSLSVLFNEYKTDANSIRKGIAAIGHDTDLVKAPDEVYESLHGCCKYERLESDCQPSCTKSCCEQKKEACKSTAKSCKTKCASGDTKG